MTRPDLGGGNSRYRDAEKDIEMTMSVGIMRKTMTSTATIYSHKRCRCVIWVSEAGLFNKFI